MTNKITLQNEIRVLTERKQALKADIRDALAELGGIRAQIKDANVELKLVARRQKNELALADEYEARRVESAEALDKVHEELAPAEASPSEKATKGNAT